MREREKSGKCCERRFLKAWLAGTKNGTAHIRHQCRKTTVLSCHRCLIKTGVEKMNSI